MPSVIDTAYVEILPQMAKFNAQTKAGIDSTLMGVQRSTTKATEGMGQSFVNSGKVIRADAAKSGNLITNTFAKLGGAAYGITRAFVPLSLGLIGIGVAAVKAGKEAGDFQSELTRLVTSAGESAGNVKEIAAGEIAIARSTGESLKDLSSSAYLVESAGYHGRDALLVLKAAAQGAKIDLADAGVVGNALTTVMKDMNAPTTQAANIMSQLVAAVGHGKMTMDDLAGSIHSVLPNATVLGLNLGQVTGALATMTAQGISADQAAQNLNHAILSLANPTAEQTKAMAAFGLNATTVAKNLGKIGLTGTLDELSKTIMAHMGPAGLTLTNAFNTSQIASQKAKEAYNALPKPLQAVADKLKAGTLAASSLKSAHTDLTLQERTLLQQWLTLQKGAGGFNALLKSGSPSALTYSAALAKMTGGSVGLQVALHLTGENMKTYQANVLAINKAHQEAGGNVEGWAQKQKTFNLQLDRFKQVIATSAIAIVNKLIPAGTAFLTTLLGLGPEMSAVGNVISTTFNQVLIPAFKDIGSIVTETIIPVIHNLWSIFSDLMPIIKDLAIVVGVTVVLAFKALTIVINDVLGPALVHNTKFIGDHQTALASIAGVITFILLPQLTALAVRSVATSVSVVASWIAQSAAAVTSGALTATVWSMYQIESFKAGAAAVASGVKVIASWVAQGVAATVNAAKIVVAWVIQTAASAAGAIAGVAALVLVGLRWVWAARQALISAARMAAAWIIAMGPIAIVTALVIGLTVLIVKNWSSIVSWTSHAWTNVRNTVVNAARAVLNWIQANWIRIIVFLTGPVGSAVSSIIKSWNRIASGAVSMKNAVGTAITGLVSFVRGIPGRVVSAIGSLGGLLYNAGSSLIGGLKNGIVGAMKGIGGWIKSSMINPIVSAVKNFFGIRSPSTVFAGIGGHLVSGLFQGMIKSNPNQIISKIFGSMPKALSSIVSKGIIGLSGLPAKALEAISGLLGGLGNMGKSVGGVISESLNMWILEAIASTGVGGSWIGPLFRRIMFESGGNPRAINLTDSNAKAGHPSMGLMQTIASTFASFRSPSLPNDVWNPVANIVAGIRYILSRYGSIFAIDPPVRGYKTGAWRVDSNQLAFLHKNEMVIPSSIADKVRGGDGASSNGVNITFAPGAIQVGSSGMDEGKLAALIAYHVKQAFNDRDRVMAKGGRR